MRKKLEQLYERVGQFEEEVHWIRHALKTKAQYLELHVHSDIGRQLLVCIGYRKVYANQVAIYYATRHRIDSFGPYALDKGAKPDPLFEVEKW